MQLQSSNLRSTTQSLSPVTTARTALATYEEAGSMFVTTVRRLFPLGTDVQVALGTERVALRVTGHSTVRPGVVYGRDTAGVERQFSAGIHDAQAIR